MAFGKVQEQGERLRRDGDAFPAAAKLETGFVELEILETPDHGLVESLSSGKEGRRS
jgi:hypothetical protein